jgi:hypothetical protein
MFSAPTPSMAPVAISLPPAPGTEKPIPALPKSSDLIWFAAEFGALALDAPIDPARRCPDRARRPIDERLRMVCSVLAAGPRTYTIQSSIEAMVAALKKVEDIWTDIPDTPEFYGHPRFTRLWLPKETIEGAWDDIPGGRRAKPTSHDVDFLDDGTILIVRRRTAQLLFRRLGVVADENAVDCPHR